MFSRRLVCAASTLFLLVMLGSSTAAPDAGTNAGKALGLVTAWELAQERSASYQAAVSGRKAAQYNRALGRSGMLPQISANFARTKTWGHLTEPGPFGDEVRKELDYTARVNEFKLSQTIFDWTKINKWRQGDARADRSLAVFEVKARNIAMRLVDRYLQVLLAQKNVTLAEMKLNADERLIRIARHLYRGGAGTITDVQKAKARRARSYADLIKARASLAVVKRKLQAMIGHPVQSVRGLKPDIELKPMQPSSLDTWIARAQENNADIARARRSLRVAAREVGKAVGNVLPTLELVASYSENYSNSISLLGVESQTTSVGLQLQVPIFAGGKHWARIQQTQYKLEQSRHKLKATRKNVATKVTRRYLKVVSGAAHIKALEEAVRTSKQTLVAIRQSYKAGKSSISDILAAQEQLHKRRRDLVKARLDYVEARIKLKVMAGVTIDKAIRQAAGKWFGPTTVAQK